ncbi:MAG: HAD-IA family hydrolase [Solobacterium sp.]|nr:HAD-IA family hydrolase [Solobacterium sp.]
MVGISGEDVLRVLEERLPELNPCLRNRMLEDVRLHGRQYLRDHLQAMPYALEILQNLKDNGYKLCIGTTTSRSLTIERLKQTGLLAFFEVLVCGDEVRSRKPDPEVYCRVCSIAGIPADKTLVVEDTGYGVEAAVKAGCSVIMVPSLNPADEKDKENAFSVVNSLKEAWEIINHYFYKAA